MTIPILGTQVSCTNYQRATDQVVVWANSAESRYVCAANVHMVMEAYDHPEFRQIVNAADLVTPDGMPLVWTMRLKGIRNQQRVYGPTLMLKVLREAERQQISVGFLGSTDEVLQNLSREILGSFPGLKITKQLSLPFRSTTPDEDKVICDEINITGLGILFVALGCPKQERWIAEHKGKINAVMIGVGAAFAFHAGMVRQAPAWIQNSGLEWLFRFSQEPRRLWKRYLVNNPRFVILVLIELLRERFNLHNQTGGNTPC